MLYPQSNPYRQYFHLGDIWDFRFDPEQRGEQEGWAGGFTGGRFIAVPSSWNDLFEDSRDYLGLAWYQTRFDLPWGWQNQQVILHFGSVNYLARVWLNGQFLGSHEGGHLPFEFEITSILRTEGNLLVVLVDGALAPDRVPPGQVAMDPKDTFTSFESYPSGSFDFFPYCGIQRPVLLYAIPHRGIQAIKLTTNLHANKGIVRVNITQEGTAPISLRLKGYGMETTLETLGSEAAIEVPNPALWEPGSPSLYELSVELLDSGLAFDRYILPVGIRTIEVDGSTLLLNHRPVLLRGFGRHEDFPVSGRGYQPAVQIKDFNLMQWVGANSFRTSHYPYSEPMMELADRLGFLVIDETPAVGLFFHETGMAHRLSLSRQYIRELIERDTNHPSVIAWSVANEPMSERPEAVPFLRSLVELAKELDPCRPVSFASWRPLQEESFDFCDMVFANIYKGWYTSQGRLSDAFDQLAQELDAIHARFPKPLLVTEFGADSLPGVHAHPPEMFSEEYQAELIEGTIRVLNTKPFVAAQHIWNLCDFKTGQAVPRMGGMNMKGIFTRDRKPKMAAHRLRSIWGHS